MAVVPSHAEYVRSVLTSGAIAGSPVATSWQRCAEQYRLDPATPPRMRRLSDAELGELEQGMEPILRSAGPALERLQRATGNRGVCQLLTNAEGIPLHWSGAECDQGELQAWGLCRGVDWSEVHNGTNGIGTSLIERRALVVRQDQHYYARALAITCASAPVYDHDGALAGALNVTFYGIASNMAPAGLLLSTITDAARQIEIDHFHRHFRHASVISLPWPARCGAVLLAVDRDNVVIGASRGARHVLGLCDAAIRQGVVASDCLDALNGAEGEDGLAHAERGAIRRALLRERGNVTATSRRLGISLATAKRKICSHAIRR
ncbi:regulatory protein, Fis family [Paracoccus alcaliphilus]|uniref:Regulatory protein, Fis family n=1 Tax=Paracoccus alcaliphilus TaxID=34002 RepID=A0A1H8FYH2_9RHOB|nr:helix-turn-helix domain-containing protein [Paracoccus alcaliphilus]WCR20244.1 sigma-54-dependent Fis family transcriptional regulator [Paracoccus alcaliphilus]SEN36287.1 regulatory protein, Fis family [Paracoccus alcaliphilus]